MKKKPIKTLWESYRDNVIPKTASSVQIQETRRAFYAGALALFQIFVTAAEKDDDEATVELFRSIQFDIDTFMESIKHN